MLIRYMYPLGVLCSFPTQWIAVFKRCFENRHDAEGALVLQNYIYRLAFLTVFEPISNVLVESGPIEASQNLAGCLSSTHVTS